MEKKRLPFPKESLAPWLADAFEQASYLGGGYSSRVWSLNNGYVLKITKDPQVLTLMRSLRNKPQRGLPQVWYVSAPIQGRGHGLWHAIVQTQYEPMPYDQWLSIVRTWKGIRWREQGFSLSNDKSRQALMTWQKRAVGTQQKQVLYRIATLLSRYKEMSVDLDHRDNWAIDPKGRPILLDPVV